MSVLSACCMLAGAAASADDPADPISKLGQRSALQRWKEARSEWMNSATSRRERRQQSKQGGSLENPLATDAAAPDAVQRVEPMQVIPPEPPGRVDLSPVTVDAAPEIPQFIVPPRMEPPSTPPLTSVFIPVPTPVEIDVPEPPVAAEMAVTVPAPLPEPASAPPVSAASEALSSPVFEPPLLVDDGVLLAPAEPAATTALLPQIPRTPVDSSPTPAPPPTRLAPAPALRLPEESPRFIVPRTDLLMPPEPDAPRTLRAAGPVPLPQLKKITEIQPFKTCSTDGGGVRMCPPNTAGANADRCPEQQPLPILEGAERNFIDIEYCWEAPNLFHTPLYFEDVSLERYGHTYCEPMQSVASVSKFGLQLAGLPYQMALAPIHKREYPLGYYRPGDPAPQKCYQVPLNAEAAFKAAYVYTGMSFIVP